MNLHTAAACEAAAVAFLPEEGCVGAAGKVHMADRVAQKTVFANGIAVYTATLQAGNNQETSVGRNGTTAHPATVYGFDLG